MASTDLDYYRVRERQERARAEHSTDPAARIAHLRMAERYHRIVESGELPQLRARPSPGAPA